MKFLKMFNTFKFKIFESFNDKVDIYKWLYDNKIISNNDIINKDNMKEFIQYFIENNSDLITKTAIKDCHAIGLNSFLLNTNPKIRLFVCENNSELYNDYDFKNPLIPIHPHKYDDLFFQIKGKLIHHIYQKSKYERGIDFTKFKFMRLNDTEVDIKNLGSDKLKYIGPISNINKLRAKVLHTASVSGDNSSWIIIETKKDESFDQISYHQDLKIRSDLYKVFDNPINYLNNWINSI